jgi:hypothetical protein
MEKYDRRFNREISVGIVPVMLLLERRNSIKLVNWPILVLNVLEKAQSPNDND